MPAIQRVFLWVLRSVDRRFFTAAHPPNSGAQNSLFLVIPADFSEINSSIGQHTPFSDWIISGDSRPRLCVRFEDLVIPDYDNFHPAAESNLKVAQDSPLYLPLASYWVRNLVLRRSASNINPFFTVRRRVAHPRQQYPRHIIHNKAFNNLQRMHP